MLHRRGEGRGDRPAGPERGRLGQVRIQGEQERARRGVGSELGAVGESVDVGSEAGGPWQTLPRTRPEATAGPSPVGEAREISWVPHARESRRCTPSDESHPPRMPSPRHLRSPSSARY